uniref:Uncharacterized protein n=1 Tax=Mus musculus TaxID=10090 RepID=Q8C426_MOUSE|nr:unnamed protein product [Mus musculus]
MQKIKCTQNSWGPLSAWTADLSGLKGSPAGGGARARVGLILPTLPIYPSIFQDQSWALRTHLPLLFTSYCFKNQIRLSCWIRVTQVTSKSPLHPRRFLTPAPAMQPREPL